MELLSRQVMRIVIPRGAFQHNGLVDVHIATPYGVSPHLSIPVLCDTPTPKAPVYGYTFTSDSRLKIQYKVDKATGKLSFQISPGDRLAISWSDPSGSVPKTATLILSFNYGKPPIVVKREVEGTGGVFSLKDLPSVAEEIFSKLLNSDQFKTDKKPPDSLTTSKATITPKNGSHAVQEVQITNSFKVDFEDVTKKK
jgi:hypothetical protein